VCNGIFVMKPASVSLFRLSILGWCFCFDVVFRHAHYQAGITPLALVWKDENCSQYVMDTDSKGQVPNQQQVFPLLPFHLIIALLSMPFLCCLYLYCLLLWVSRLHIENSIYGSLVPLVEHFVENFSCFMFIAAIYRLRKLFNYDLEVKLCTKGNTNAVMWLLWYSFSLHIDVEKILCVRMCTSKNFFLYGI